MPEPVVVTSILTSMVTSPTVNSEALRRAPATGTALQARKKRPFLLDLYSTAVGKKYAMAISGIAMMGFVLFHMIGNLKMYLGAEALDHYAEFLQELLYPILPKNVMLWILRGGLVSMLLLHLHAAWSLTMLNRHARPVKYQGARDYQVAKFASRTMRWTGIIVLAYLVWHLLDFTFGTVNAVGTDSTFVRGEVYNNVVRSLDRPVVAAFYVIANILLGIHLFHGAWSIFQSLGWNNPRFNNWRRGFATGFATIIVVGNVSFPIAVIAGIVQ
jgi:succinate dehydrogenase / fumarate reductase cytochrome b subunit